MKKIDPRIHIGEQYGVFVIEDVLSEDQKDKHGHWVYKAVCKECGFVKYSHYGGIKSPITKTCTHINMAGKYCEYNTDWSNKRLAGIFSDMKNRCYNQNSKDYRFYGAKGIQICEEWINDPKKFEDWAMANGYADNLTIDRVESSKNYCPENCRWITLEHNSKYKSTTSLINVDGEIHTGRDWSKILGFGVNQINNYVRQYGLDNTVEFIRRYRSEPKRHKTSKQSYYDLYMSNN